VRQQDYSYCLILFLKVGAKAENKSVLRDFSLVEMTIAT
jgi:hypothetical protein